MAEGEEEKSNKERKAEGQILVRTILEMLGGPKEHIVNTMKAYVDKLGENKNFKIDKTFISEAKEQEDKSLFSIYAELEIWFKDVDKIMEFCFDSLPSSIEIIEPEEFKMKSNKFSGLLNDLQAKLHKLDLAFKNHIADKQASAKIFDTLIKNFIGYCLRTKKQKVEEVATITGIDKEKLQKIMDDLAENKMIKKEGDKYSID